MLQGTTAWTIGEYASTPQQWQGLLSKGLRTSPSCAEERPTIKNALQDWSLPLLPKD